MLFPGSQWARRYRVFTLYLRPLPESISYEVGSGEGEKENKFSMIRGGGKPRNTTLADPHRGSKTNVAKVDIRGKQTLTRKQIGPSISTSAVPPLAGHATDVAEVVLLGGVLSRLASAPAN